MIKQNQWVHGARDFRLPPVPDEKVRAGCSFLRTTFDREIGEEVFVRFMEDPPHAQALASIQPMTLLAHKGIVGTPHGPVAYVVWQIAAHSPQESFVETFLNPFRFNTLKLVSDAVNQTHLKFVAVDRSDQSVVAMIDFENVFDLDQLLYWMVMNIGHTEEGNFAAATDFVMANAQTHELLANAF